MGGVILSEAKDLSMGSAQILRFAQDDTATDGTLWRPVKALPHPLLSRPYNDYGSGSPGSFIVGAGVVKGMPRLSQASERFVVETGAFSLLDRVTAGRR